MPEVGRPNVQVNEEYEQKYGFHDSDDAYLYKAAPGLTRRLVEEISYHKSEPEWMRKFRLQSLETFFKKPMPNWGNTELLNALNFDAIHYYMRPVDRKGDTWEDVPAYIKNTFEKLGIPEAERKFLAGVSAQYESETVYHSIRSELEKQGVIFLDTDTALKEHPEIFRRYFGTVIPPADNKFAALNSAVWSGGSFIYVPPNTHVKLPLQAYFRINAKNMGQFERTLIIADEGSSVHYIEGCTAPVYSSDSLHSAVVELIAMKGAHIRYTTIQNWSKNVYNLVTKRAAAHEGALIEWVDGNLGCLAGTTEIFLNSDVKTISEVRPGEAVFALTDRFGLSQRQIVARKYSGRQKVYRLRTVNHREIKATANHPFLALRKWGKFSSVAWIPLEELRPGDLVGLSGDLPDTGKPRPIHFAAVGKKPIRIPQQTTEDLMWLVGVYLGDGYCDRNRVYFAVPEKDKAADRLADLLHSVFGTEGERRGAVLRIASVDLVRFFRDTLGLAGNARQKRIPRWVYTLPRAQREALLEGYIAADGYRRSNHTNLSITSCNRALLEDTKSLAMTCGWNPMKISTWRRKEKKPLGTEEKEYTHHFLYFGERKFDQPVVFAPIAEITEAGEEDTWDIEVEGAHNFVANGFIVHNSKLTMKYPGAYLLGPKAKLEVLSVAYANSGQHQDAGGKAIHAAPETTSTITSKSISKGSGRTSYRGLVKVQKGAKKCKSLVRCDALLLDEESRSDTYPYIENEEDDVALGHEATVSKVGEEQLFYLQSRGLKEQEAVTMIVNGFIECFTKELPLEYAVELNRLIQLEMTGAAG